MFGTLRKSYSKIDGSENAKVPKPRSLISPILGGERGKSCKKLYEKLDCFYSLI